MYSVLARESFVINPEFEGLSVSELIDPSFSNWVHHIQYVLPQVSTLQDYRARDFGQVESGRADEFNVVHASLLIFCIG